LDRIFKGRQLKKEFDGGSLRIIPTTKGKRVQEKDNNINR
jgi:predicted SpoU family rRNA methylase